MSYISLDTIMNSITGYSKTMEQFEFKADGTGTRPWSQRYLRDNGDVIEFNAQGWDLFSKGMAYTGLGHLTLKSALLADCTKEELIRMLTV